MHSPTSSALPSTGGETLSPVFRDRFVPFSEVSHATGLGRSYLYGQIKIGKFPRPYKFGKRASRWRLSEVQPRAG